MPQYFMIIVWVALLGFLWFRVLKPQRDRQKEVVNLQQNVQVGDRVITIGGIVGKVTYVGDQDFNLDVNGVTMTFKKWAIGQSDVTALEEPEPVASFELEENVETPVLPEDEQ